MFRRHKWLKRFLLGLGSLVVLFGLFVGGLFLWYQVRYSATPWFTHNRITISLPFAPEDEATSIRALGEVEQVHPDGHGGMDFQWDQSVPIRSIADGRVSSIKRAEDMGDPVWYISIDSREYRSTYKEMENYVDGLATGSLVKQGQEIGRPHCTNKPDGVHTHCQIHWEFSYASGVPTFTGHLDRLCPLTYFDAEASRRITAIWDEVTARNATIPGYPDLCNGPFKGFDQ
ncbi:MAG: M23 family metallopeptidase [Candidatus Andersenbacteria bacterium]